MAEKEPLPLLRVRTYYSNLDHLPSPASPERVFTRAKELGYKRLAITERGNVYSLGRSFRQSSETGVSYIPGVELPVDVGVFDQPVWTTFLARNNRGLQEIFRLSSLYKNDQVLILPSDLEKAKDDLFILMSGKASADYLAQENIFYALDALAESPCLASWVLAKSVAAPQWRLTGPEGFSKMEFLTQAQTGMPASLKDMSNLTMVTPDFLNVLYGNFPAAVENALTIAGQCRVEKPRLSGVRPKIVPEGVDPKDYFLQLVREGAKRLPDDPQLHTRLAAEAKLMTDLGYQNYILICLGIVQDCRKDDIPVLISGSANNSLVLWALGMTTVPPFDLRPERFASHERQDDPDIDILVPYDYRSLVVRQILRDYDQATLMAVVKKWGLDGIVRVMREQGLSLNLDTIQTIEAEGVPKNVSTHPTGITFVRHWASDWLAGKSLAQLDKEDVEKIFRFPKVDLISNIGLAVYKRALDQVESGGNKLVIPENDRVTFGKIFSGQLLVWGIESPHLQTMTSIMGTRSLSPGMTELEQALALARPAGTVRGLYYNNLEFGPADLSAFPQLSRIIKPTLNTVIYQEQVTAIAREVAGLPPGVAERFRKLMDSNAPDWEKDSLLSLLREGLFGSGLTPQLTDQIMGQVEGFASYGFVAGHARALANLVYPLAYLAVHEPKAYWGAVISTLAEKKEERNYPPVAYTNAALRHGAVFAFPPVDELRNLPEFDQKQITVGRKLFGDIKHFGEVYNQFYARWQKDPASSELIKWQLDQFGFSLTGEPITLFKPRLWFNPAASRQEIVGQFIGLSRIRRPGGVKTNDWFVTLDSHGLVHAHLTSELMARHQKDLNGRFWHVIVTGLPGGVGGREIVQVLKPAG